MNIVWNKKTIIGLSIGLIFVFSIFFFLSNLILYTLVAFVVSMIGRPLVQWMHKKLKCPFPIASIVSMVVIIGFIGVVLWFVLPMFIRQGQRLINIDYAQFTSDTYLGFGQLTLWLESKGVYIPETELKTYVMEWLQQFIAKINVQSVISNTVGIVSSFGVGLSCVLFITFFFLKDEKLFKKMLFLFIPDNYTSKVENILKSSELLLTRYFRGLTIEVLCMMTFLSLGLFAFGIDNALLYGCLGGVLNIIPYLGPVIGAVIASIFALINHLDVGFSMDQVWIIVKVVGVFAGSNLIDNFILQPFIYSNSIKAHPLEVFFVIIIAGTLTGPGGMILAVPIYTVLRIIAKEFFRDTKIVKELTKGF